MRRCLLVGSSIIEIKTHILALITFAICLLPITLLTNRICMAKARKHGSFATH
jgi:hypothetical protein